MRITRSPVLQSATRKGATPLRSTIALLIALVSLCYVCVAQTGPNDESNLKVKSNLVVIRAVVRDKQGKPIESLGKEDFKVLDRGREQTITQFEVETLPVNAAITPSPVKPEHPASTLHGDGQFIALYFDDLHISDTDMIEVRHAAAAYFRDTNFSNEEVSIFTSEGRLVSFVADPKLIEDALSELRAKSSEPPMCPDLSDHQAQRIVDFPDNITIDAWKQALEEAITRCHTADPSLRKCLIDGACPDTSPQLVAFMHATLAQATEKVEETRMRTAATLKSLQQVVAELAVQHGQRTLVLVSPGFSTETTKDSIDDVVEQALRAQVVINSLDPKGLALLMRESDVKRGYIPAANSGVTTTTHNLDFQREQRATEVLEQVADSTGGQFFHNNNDLRAGFNSLATSPTSYILAFVPATLDGKFHKLEVKLTRSKGTVRARRGYFAINNGAAQLVDRASE